MTKLKLLGAQRVKALTEILERKFADKIKEVEEDRIGQEEAVKVLAEEKGLSRMLDEILSHESALIGLKMDAHNKLGVGVEVNVSYRSYHMLEETRKELNKIADNGVGKKVSQIRRELEDRKSQLWLVETLEEAQNIVNSEIEVD